MATYKDTFFNLVDDSLYPLPFSQMSAVCTIIDMLRKQLFAKVYAVWKFVRLSA